MLITVMLMVERDIAEVDILVHKLLVAILQISRQVTLPRLMAIGGVRLLQGQVTLL